MRKTMITIGLSLCLITLYAKNYYVDSAAGNDSAAGTTPKTAWRSVEKVNATTFVPGDSILFLRNGVWQKSLQPKGSGKKGAPIVVAGYGRGERPLIAGDGFTGCGVVSLHNQSWWHITELELTNYASEPGDRRGVEVKGENGGLLQHIHLKNLLIHHISGIVGGDRAAKSTAGIQFVVTDDKIRSTRFDDLLVEGCTIHDIQNQGIVLNNETFEFSHYPGDESWNARKFTNVRIRNNVIHHISKNAMIIRMTDGGVVEHNVCWWTAQMEQHGGNTIFSRNVRGTLFRYNEGFQNRSRDHDGSLYDPDLNSPETVWERSYSHDNAQGLIWFCTNEKDNDMLVRDNLSEDDHRFLIYINYPFSSAHVYRNLFYAGLSVNPYFLRDNVANAHLDYSVKNNLVFNRSNGMNYKYQYPVPVTPNLKNKSDISGNMFLGNRLEGEYKSEQISTDSFIRFHRGFLRTNGLDTLLGNKITLFRPGSADGSDAVVGTIAGMPVYHSEVEREKRRCRWDGSEGDECLVNLRRIKVEQREMARRGMPEAAVFGNFSELLRMENNLRSSTPLDKVVWFGPETYSADDYWDYFMANAREELQKLMSRDALVSSEEELRAYFVEGDSEKGVWKKRGFDYARTAVTTRLLDKKYEEYFEDLANEATVDAKLLWPKFLSETTAAPSGVAVRKDIAFLAPDRKERMDLYLPELRPSGVRSPAVVWIHGGGWTGGKKDASREVNVCATLAAVGYVCVSIEYRLGAGAWPQNLFDCKAAVRYLRDHAKELDINPERIAVAGGSAGGHLALMVGLTSGKPGFEPDNADKLSSGSVRCVIDFYGVTNLSTRQETEPDGTPTGKNKSGGAIRVFGDESNLSEVFKQVSPVTHVTPQSPPVMILHGRADTTVDYAQSTELAAKLKEAGVPHELVLIDGIGHTFDLQKWGKKKLPADVQASVLSFLDKYLK